MSNIPEPPLPKNKDQDPGESKITAVFIACYSGDVHLARICIASVRHWYPEIPIFLVKDDHRRPFRTHEIEKAWEVSILETSEYTPGWLNKLQVFLTKLTGRGLFLDADIVLTGPVIDVLEQHSEDILVCAEPINDPRSDYVRTHFFDWGKMQDFDPEFEFPGYCFNSGQFVWNLGSIDRSAFAGVVSWDEDPPRLLHPDIFRCLEQGATNYAVLKKAQEAGLKIGSVDFGRWIYDTRVEDFSVEEMASGNGYPYVLHWASPEPKQFVGELAREDILRFYEDIYYSRIKFGCLIRNIRAASRIPSRTLRWLRDSRNKAKIGTRLKTRRSKR